MIGLKLILASLLLWTMCLSDNYPLKQKEGLTKKEIKSIYLLIVRKDEGNATRSVREIKLDRSKFKDLTADLNSTETPGLVDVDTNFTIVITTKNNKEIRLVGRDKILLDKERGRHYKAEFNWTIKYWNKDLSQGGF